MNAGSAVIESLCNKQELALLDLNGKRKIHVHSKPVCMQVSTCNWLAYYMCSFTSLLSYYAFTLTL